jgi:hypothetical protein
MPEHERRPLAMAQRGHGRVDAVLNFGTQHESLRCVVAAVVGGFLAAHGLEVGRVVSCLPVRPGPNQIDRTVHSDAM